MNQRPSILSIINIAFRQMGSLYQAKNPMFLFVLIISCLALIIFSKQIFYQTDKILLYGQITFWLWVTIFFSSLVESIAISHNPNFYLDKAHEKKTFMVKKLSTIMDLDNYKKISKASVRAGNLILLESGDEVPFDGEVVYGMCYVNEADVTGSLGHKLKSSNKDNILVTGSIIESHDVIVMKVSFAPKKSFFARVRKLLKTIDRQVMPSEIALQRLTLGLAALFIVVILLVWVLASYFGLKIPYIYLIALIAILMPTTISGLQRAIVYHGQVKLADCNITVQDQVAFDNAVDINIVLVDKTGTLTMGIREMVDFRVTSDLLEKDYYKYLYLSSVDDDTKEGESIASFVLKSAGPFRKPQKNKLYEYLPFSSSNPISGCNYNGIEIRKGSLKAIAKYLGKTIRSLPKEVQAISTEIAKAHGTPVVFTVDKEIIGVINLRDRFRRGIIKQLKAMQDIGLNVVMVTGDNAITASYIAKELGIKSFYADQTPEKKLALIRSLQKKGYVIAMCGDGVNDALALAGADIGYTFEDEGHVHAVLSGNIVSKYHDLSGLLELKKQCQKITIKRGALTVYSIASDLAKYFVIVPALFTTAFPVLTKLNVMQFKSLDSVILASVMFNALVIPCLIPLVFYGGRAPKNKNFLWRSILLYGFGGIISPLVFIKLIELIIYKIGLI